MHTRFFLVIWIVATCFGCSAASSETDEAFPGAADGFGFSNMTFAAYAGLHTTTLAAVEPTAATAHYDFYSTSDALRWTEQSPGFLAALSSTDARRTNIFMDYLGVARGASESFRLLGKTTIAASILSARSCGTYTLEQSGGQAAVSICTAVQNTQGILHANIDALYTRPLLIDIGGVPTPHIAVYIRARQNLVSSYKEYGVIYRFSRASASARWSLSDSPRPVATIAAGQIRFDEP